MTLNCPLSKQCVVCINACQDRLLVLTTAPVVGEGGGGFLWSQAPAQLGDHPFIHSHPNLHAQLPPNAANTACAFLEVSNGSERLWLERLQVLDQLPGGEDAGGELFWSDVYLFKCLILQYFPL